jgi:hypothetical protein
MAAVRDYGEPVVDDPSRIDAVSALGIDETSFLKANAEHPTELVTGFVDLERHVLLDMVLVAPAPGAKSAREQLRSHHRLGERPLAHCKKHPTQERVNHLRRRVGVQPPSRGEGEEGQDSGPSPPFQLEARLSMAGAHAYAPDGSKAMFIFSMQPGSFNDDALIVFLTELRDLLGEEKATVIWDGLMSHRSKKMAVFVASQRRWLVTERLPPYGHDLNPVEQVWGNVKGTELANLCPETIGEPAAVCRCRARAHRGDGQLCFAFLRHTGLSL